MIGESLELMADIRMWDGGIRQFLVDEQCDPEMSSAAASSKTRFGDRKNAFAGHVWTLPRMQAKSSLSLERWSGADVCPASSCDLNTSRAVSNPSKRRNLDLVETSLQAALKLRAPSR